MQDYRKNYEKYLSSKEWKKKREDIAKKRNYICEKCNKYIEKGYHIHHKNYKNFGNEKDEDLLFLCENCHNETHHRDNEKKDKFEIDINILKDKDFISLNSTSKVLYIYMKMWANNKKTFYYSYSLANKVIGSRTTIFRNIKELEEKHFIKIEKIKNKNLFTLLK